MRGKPTAGQSLQRRHRLRHLAWRETQAVHAAIDLQPAGGFGCRVAIPCQLPPIMQPRLKPLGGAYIQLIGGKHPFQQQHRLRQPQRAQCQCLLHAGDGKTRHLAQHRQQRRHPVPISIGLDHRDHLRRPRLRSQYPHVVPQRRQIHGFPQRTHHTPHNK